MFLCMEKVGIGHFRVLAAYGILSAHGLGSCIGLFLYDPEVKIGGLAHIMLPGSRPENLPVMPSRYAENAFEIMVKEMTSNGASLRRIGAVVVGGAHMFRDVYDDVRQTIGQKNQDSILEILRRQPIPVIAQDLGGGIGRTMEANVENGNVTVKTIGSGTREFSWIR